jgi:VanZ family protein
VTAKTTRTVQIAVAVAIVGGLVVAQQFGQFPVQTRFTTSLSNWLHVPMFAIITFAISALVGHAAWARTLAIVATIAVATELLQSFVGRNASLVDLFRDGLGIGIAMATIGGMLRFNRPAGACLLGTAVLIVTTLAIPAMYLVAHAQQARAFPVLYTPGSIAARWLSDINSQSSTTKQHTWTEYVDRDVLAITWADLTWPGLHLYEPLERWDGYAYVSVDAFNLEDSPQPLTIAVRHHKRGGTSRFHQMMLEPGANRVRVAIDRLAKDRQGAPANIKHIILHTSRKHGGKQIWLGQVTLAK